MSAFESWPGPEPDRSPRFQADRPFWGYADLVLLVAAGVPALLLAIILAASLGHWAELGEAPKAVQALLVQFFVYLFWFAALYALLHGRHRQPFWRSLAWVGPPRMVFSYLSAGPVLAVAVGLAGSLIGTPRVDLPIRALLSDPLSIALVGLFATTLGPLCEELAFRGFVQPLLSATLGPAAGIVLAALPFAVLHGPQYGWSWRHVMLIALAGSMFGWVRHRTGSTAAAAAMHSTYNLAFFVGFILHEGIPFK